MARLMYQCTALVGTNLKGVLKADADGYYPVVLGAFDYYNACGDFYPLAPVKHLFESSGPFQRRINRAALRGEYGHPKFVPGMSKRDFIMRVMEIREANVSHHIADVYIDMENYKDERGKVIPTVLGRVKPCGPHGEALAASFENPKENVCFSIRSLTEDIVTPTGTIKNIVQIVTWDYVNEPGINIATKYHSPGLESYGFDKEQFVLAKNLLSSTGVSMESDQLRNINEAIHCFERVSTQTESGLILPPSAKW